MSLNRRLQRRIDRNQRPDAPVPAVDFSRIAQQAGREFMGSQEARQPDSPFAHYTDGRGFAGIMGNGKIWGTDYRRLNDREELIIGENAVQAELDAIIHEHPETTALAFICRLVEEARRGRRLIDITDIFVTSFSREADLLSQWRPYAADGEGYSIVYRSLPLPVGGVKPRKLTAGLGVDFRSCLYRADEFRQRVRETLAHVAADYERWVLKYCRNGNDRLERKIRVQAVSSTLAKLGALVPFLKHDGFKDEREWRLVHMGAVSKKKRLRRHSARYGDIDYIEVPLLKPHRMDLFEVIAGPRVKDLGFARATLDSCGYGHVPLTRSKVPYR